MTEDTAAVVRRFVDQVANAHDLAAVDDLCTPDHVLYHPALPRIVRGTADMKRALAEVIWAPFPDYRLAIHDVVADGDRVAIRITFSATNTGSLNGAAATGRPIDGTGIVLYRLVDGRIAETHIEEDILRILLHLEVIPSSMKALYWLKKLGVVWLLQRLGKIPSKSPLSAEPPPAGPVS